MVNELLTSLALAWAHEQSMIIADILPPLHIIDEPHQAIIQASPLVHKNMQQISEVTHGDTKKPLIALTFDDGFAPAESQIMLDTLKEKHVQATFFLKGNWIAEEPVLTQTILADGHEIGNHSYAHPQFTKLTPVRARQEIQDQEDILVRDHQYSPRPYFRFPYGARNAKMMKIVNAMGYTSIMWDVDTLDWEKDSNYVANEALTKAHNGAIILMHLGKPATAKALPLIIDGLRAKGFQLVTISTLIDNDDSLSS